MTTHDWLDRAALARYSVEPRQFIDFREATLPDGQRVNRRLQRQRADLHRPARSRAGRVGRALQRAPADLAQPEFAHLPDFGLPWLQQFNGGLVVIAA